MRSDAIGLFWQDLPVEKVAKAAPEKRTPPPRTWEDPSYLPGLREAIAFNVPQFTGEELIMAAMRREELLWDCEVYPNYFCAAFASYVTGKVLVLEGTPESPLDCARLKWMMETFTTVGFNSATFDMYIAHLAVAGKSNAVLMEATQQLIVQEMRGSDVLKHHKVKRQFEANHIDLIEVAPLSASLKIYGGRLHVPKMQDLPFPPGTWLTPEQMAIVRFYCVNDLTGTGFLRACLQEQLALRASMSDEYRVDLRSKSDAQIAEAVIGKEVGNLLGHKPEKPYIMPGTRYFYRVPPFMQFKTDLLQWVLNRVATTEFVVAENGAVGMPPALADLALPINGSVYRMGIGGLHSSEESVAHVAADDEVIVDRDVTSYYPKIILNLGLYPQHLGTAFLRVYQSLVDRRLRTKAAGDKVIANSLKIVINGSFGKLGSKYSILYSPDLLIQVTLTGQLSLLMLIERLELAGFQVLSANTDGIVVKCKRSRREEMNAIYAQWERDTGFETEETEYRALYSRDVNNYIAIKTDGKTKNKGVFANPWVSAKDPAEKLHKNPQNQICVEAVERFLVAGVPVAETVRACKDVRKLVTVRNVSGGAVKLWPDGGEFLGKSVRFYYSVDAPGDMVYAKSGNLVPRSEGAKPLMELPTSLPEDVDFDWYEREAIAQLSTLGWQAPEPIEL